MKIMAKENMKMTNLRERLDRRTVVVIGNGMVGHRFCENLVECDVDKKYRIVTFCEEPRPAYNRVNLTKFFSYRDAEPSDAGPARMVSRSWHYSLRGR